jgi:hypothetical protein
MLNQRIDHIQPLACTFVRDRFTLSQNGGQKEFINHAFTELRLGDSVNTRIEIGGMHTFAEKQYPLEVRNSFGNSKSDRKECV